MTVYSHGLPAGATHPEVWALIAAAMDGDHELVRSTAQSVGDDEVTEVLSQLAIWCGFFTGTLEACNLRPRDLVQHMALTEQIGVQDG